MGATHVTVTIRNPADPERAWEGLFLVDTGATDSLVPRPHLEAIGLKPEGRRTYELANGAELPLDVTIGRIEFMGEVVGGTIIFGEAGAEPILGVTALESVGIEVDPLNELGGRRGRSLSLSKGRGWDAKAGVTAGFVSTGSPINVSPVGRLNHVERARGFNAGP